MESVPISGDDPKPTERPMVTPAQPPLGLPTRPRVVNVAVILLLLGVAPLFVIFRSERYNRSQTTGLVITVAAI
jgi:hypothetical protein